MRPGTSSRDDPMPHPSVGEGVAALQIVCAWCQQPLHRHPMPLPARFPISYSICAYCYGDVLREIAANTECTGI